MSSVVVASPYSISHQVTAAGSAMPSKAAAARGISRRLRRITIAAIPP
jgi:hypothetical protein